LNLELELNLEFPTYGNASPNMIWSSCTEVGGGWILIVIVNEIQ